MSILNVEHLTHGFGDRAIFADVSFRLLKGEHIGLVGANGEGKSTFLNIVTGKLAREHMPSQESYVPMDHGECGRNKVTRLLHHRRKKDSVDAAPAYCDKAAVDR